MCVSPQWWAGPVCFLSHQESSRKTTTVLPYTPRDSDLKGVGWVEGPGIYAEAPLGDSDVQPAMRNTGIRRSALGLFVFFIIPPYKCPDSASNGTCVNPESEASQSRLLSTHSCLLCWMIHVFKVDLSPMEGGETRTQTSQRKMGPMFISSSDMIGIRIYYLRNKPTRKLPRESSVCH